MSATIYPQQRIVSNGYGYAVQQRCGEHAEWGWFRGFIFSVPQFTAHAENAELFMWEWSARSTARKLSRYATDERVEKAKHGKEWIEIT